MRWTQYQYRYPSTAYLLPSNFPSIASHGHRLRRAIEHNRQGYLDNIESLVRKTPSKSIANGSYQNSLHEKTSFSGFYAEMRAALVLEQFCTPVPADVAGGNQLPDLECRDLGRHGVDFEVWRFANWDKQLDVQEALADKFDGTPYTPEVEWLDPYFVMPYDSKEIAANERFVKGIIKKIQNTNLSKGTVPSVIQNYGVRIELRSTGASRGMIGTSSVRAYPVDPEGVIADRLTGKAKKQRGYRPLVITLDSRLPFLGEIDMRQIVHGTRVSSSTGVQPASQLSNTYPIWKEYMDDNGTLKIPKSETGIFANPEFQRVAGILFIDQTDTCVYLPNCYAKCVDYREIHNTISGTVDGLNVRELL